MVLGEIGGGGERWVVSDEVFPGEEFEVYLLLHSLKGETDFDTGISWEDETDKRKQMNRLAGRKFLDIHREILLSRKCSFINRWLR